MTDDASRATLDRIVDDEHAVLLVEDDAGDVVDERVVDADDLPADGRHEGAVFDLTIVGGDLRAATYRPDETEARRAAAQDRLDRLSTPLGETSQPDEQADAERADDDQTGVDCEEE